MAPQLATKLFVLETYLHEMERGYYSARRYLNEEWRAAAKEYVPIMGQLTYGLKCNSTIQHVLTLSGHFKWLAGQLALAGILCSLLALCSLGQTCLSFMMTSRLKLYYLKMGMEEELPPVEEDDTPARMDWERINLE